MTSLAELQARRLAAAEHLERAALLAPDHADALLQAAERLRQGRLAIVLVGSFSTGKSTLVNAMLGRPLLPARVNPCTAVPCELRYGPELSVTLTPADGGPPERGTLDALAQTLDLATEDRAPAVFATVEAPLPLLGLGVTLLDTPGLDEDDARTAATLAALQRADAVIFASSATRFLTELERQVIREHLLPAGLDNLFVAVTMVDLLERVVDDPAAARDDLKRRAHRALGPLVSGPDERVFLLSPRQALLARWDRRASAPVPDAVTPESSGIPAFEAALERYLVEERGLAQLRGAASRARRLHDHVAAQLALQRATATDTLAALTARQQELEPRLAGLDRLCERVERLTEQAIQRAAALVRQDLRELLWELEAALPEAVEAADLSGVSPLVALAPAGQAEAQRLLQAHLDGWIAERTEAWQARLAVRLEQSLSGLQRDLAQAATDFDAVAGDVLRRFAGGTTSAPHTVDGPGRGERWFSAALGAVLLSPGAVVAGWTDGYAGALKGAAGRLGARLTATTLAAALGPAGWAGLAVYALADAALLWSSGGAQLRRLRQDAVTQVGASLRERASAPPEQIEAPLREALQPLVDTLGADVRADAAALRAQLDELLTSRSTVEGDGQRALDALEAQRAALEDLALQVEQLARPE